MNVPPKQLRLPSPLEEIANEAGIIKDDVRGGLAVRLLCMTPIPIAAMRPLISCVMLGRSISVAYVRLPFR